MVRIREQETGTLRRRTPVRPARVVIATIVFAVGVSVATAQSGGLTVEVVDSDGPLAGATVTISHPTGFIKTTSLLTDEDGIVEFPVLRPGRGYTIEASFAGLGKHRVDDLEVKISRVSSVTVQLTERLTERVKVTTEGAVVDLEKVSSSVRFSDEFIQDLPVQGRFYQNILPLTPGVQDANGDGNPNVHGSRDRDFKAIVSGISNVDPLTGQQGMQINPNSIEEMEVITAGAGVEFSRAQGGFARIVQKQGSNEFEGVFEFYYRTSKLDGEGAGDSSNLPAPDFQWVQPAIQLSGPIVKDRLWYRLSHETSSSRTSCRSTSRTASWFRHASWPSTRISSPGKSRRETSWRSSSNPTRWRSTIGG
jgi:outer membrane receptor protein involved in Fe transport